MPHSQEGFIMNNKQTSGKTLLINMILIGCMIVIGLSIWLGISKVQRRPQHYTQQDSNALQQGTAFPKATAIKAFALIDDNEDPFTNDNLKGHWSLLFFGFVNCAKICPTTLSELNKAYQILEKKDEKKLPKVIFISVDPERDSPADIKQYVTRFNENFIGATGEQLDLRQLTKNLGISYIQLKKPEITQNDYQISHSATILVINPEGEWAGILSPPFNAQVMANDFMKIQQKAKSGE